MTNNTIKPPNHRFQDITGVRFGRLIPYEWYRNTNGTIYWSCWCDCGNTHTVRSGSLRIGGSLSCGCLHRDIVRNRITHGQSRKNRYSPEYKAWHGMKARCAETSGATYRLYGGRGIRVCERWGIFQNFLDDMGPKPSALHSLDRIDSNGNYESNNCRWATRRTQNRNTRRNRFLTFQGETLTFVEWSERLGIKYSTLFGRWQKGLPLEQILSKEKFKTGSRIKW